jgi:hypothetical protein
MLVYLYNLLLRIMSLHCICNGTAGLFLISTFNLDCVLNRPYEHTIPVHRHVSLTIIK